jgi:hypothetical protein
VIFDSKIPRKPLKSKNKFLRKKFVDSRHVFSGIFFLLFQIFFSFLKYYVLTNKISQNIENLVAPNIYESFSILFLRKVSGCMRILWMKI